MDNYKIALETAEKCSQSNHQFQKISEVSWDGAVPSQGTEHDLTMSAHGDALPALGTPRGCPQGLGHRGLCWRAVIFGHCRGCSLPCAGSGWAQPVLSPPHSVLVGAGHSSPAAFRRSVPGSPTAMAAAGSPCPVQLSGITPVSPVLGTARAAPTGQHPPLPASSTHVWPPAWPGWGGGDQGAGRVGGPHDLEP